MRILIVESDPGLASVWQCHLERQGNEVTAAMNQDQAISILQRQETDIIVLNLLIDAGSAFAIADFACYRRPKARIIFVTSSSFFSDGSIFRHIPNACAFLPSDLAPDDLSAVIEHYGLECH